MVFLVATSTCPIIRFVYPLEFYISVVLFLLGHSVVRKLKAALMQSFGKQTKFFFMGNVLVDEVIIDNENY